MDLVTIINTLFAQAGANYVAITGLPADTFIPAFVGSAVLGFLSF